MSKFVSNSFQVPNAFVDDILNQLSGNACKIYLLIVRKTRGWHKEADRISYSQIQKFTGVNSRTTISKALDELLDLGLIIMQNGNEKSSNEYRLNDGFASPKNGLDKNCTSPKNEPASPKNGLEPSPKNGHTEIHISKNTNTKDKSEYDTHTHESQTFENSQNPISQQTQSVDNGILEKSKSKTTKPKITYEPPIDLKPTEKQIEDCNKLGVNVDLEFEKFLNWALSKGQGYANWSRAFSNWIGNINSFGKPKNTPSTQNFAEAFKDPQWEQIYGNNFYGNNQTFIGE